MRVVKRLHLFVLKSFLPLFAMTFFIVLFIVLMQFLWRYIDDLVGKGLSLDVIGELFFYAAVSMVPMALPLAILLASLMTFGNFGERFELTAMKAAGISLVRVMAPLIIFISAVAVGAFFFQNDVLPKAQVKMWTLLFSMRQKSPEVEIPEGVFYDQIPGINMFVSHKNRDTGMLYNVKIYDVRHGGEYVTILASDSAKMALTEDMKYIYLYMYRGYQYERMQANSTMSNDPFRRESFLTKQILIPFDANFNRLDEGGMREQYVGKNIRELQNTIDSLNYRLDSVGVENANRVANQTLPSLADRTKGMRDKFVAAHSAYDPEKAEKKKNKNEIRVTPKEQQGGPITAISIDSLVLTLDPGSRTALFSSAVREASQKKGSILYDSEYIAQDKKILRRHGIELLKKFTLSVACIIFFFIGAPLGAIIRKGGIGAPLVISVILFLFYYIIDNTGYKMARDGHSAVWFGMWLSTFILAPLGIFVTYKAMRDSAVFDPDRIRMFFRRILNKREQRHVTLKEVIINEMIPEVAEQKIMALDSLCRRILSRIKRRGLLKGIFLDATTLRLVGQVAERVDSLVDYLHDSRDKKIIAQLSSYPIIPSSRFMLSRTARRDMRLILSLDETIGSLLYPDRNIPESPESEVKENTGVEDMPSDAGAGSNPSQKRESPLERWRRRFQ